MSWAGKGISSPKFWKDLIIMIFGILVGGISLYYFLLPTGVVIGTVTGLAMVLNALIPIIKVSQFVLILNVILVALALIVVGKEFGLKSIVASIFLGLPWIYANGCIRLKLFFLQGRLLLWEIYGSTYAALLYC